MKPSKDLDEQIDKILTKLENAVEHSTLRRVANRQDVSNKTIHAASKQQLLALIEQREREARIDELEALHKSEIANQSIKKMQMRIGGRIEALQKGEL